MTRESSTPRLDGFDHAILRALAENGRLTHAALGRSVGLSSSAVARRQAGLEEIGLIKGYRARIDFAALGYRVSATICVKLESQAESYLEAFERAVAQCAPIVRCVLTTGSDDYVLTVLAHDLESYERFHRHELSRLPGVTRIETRVTIREVINRKLPSFL